MHGSVAKLMMLFDTRDRLRAGLLLGMMVVGAGFETIGIGFILPYIGVLSNPDLVRSNPILHAIGARFHLHSPESFLIVGALVLLGFYFFKNLYLALVAYTQHRFISERQSLVSTRLFRAYLLAPYGLHLRRNSSDLLKNFATEIGSVFTGIISPLFTLIAECLVVLMVSGFLLAVEPKVTALALATLTGALFIFHRLQQPVLRKSSAARAHHSGERLKWVGEGLGAIKEILVARRQDYFIEAFTRSNQQYARASGIFATVNALPRLFVETIALVVILGVVIMLLVAERPLAQILPTLGLFAVAALRMMPSASRIFAALTSIRFYLPAIDSVHADIVRIQPMTKRTGEVATVTHPSTREFRALTLRDVSYRYESAPETVLTDISFRLDRGSAIAIVGASGAGKSTLVDLVLGLHAPTVGLVCLDDRDIHSMLERWQDLIGYVPQAPFLIDDSIRRNIAFAVDDAKIDDSKVWECLAAAQLDRLVREYPSGLESTIGERGARLSGGERQRLAIARALYRDPAILVCDEATSALDATTEESVIRTLLAMKGHRTILIVAHRLNTLRGCDRLYFLCEGKITASGSFDELYDACDPFREMVLKQLGDNAST